MILKFRDWELDPERSESDTYDVFRAAFRDASDPSLRDTVMEEKTHLWPSGGVELEITPGKEDEQVFFLTWGLWHTALRGVDNFRRFYPKLNVVSRFVFTRLGMKRMIIVWVSGILRAEMGLW